MKEGEKYHHQLKNVKTVGAQKITHKQKGKRENSNGTKVGPRTTFIETCRAGKPGKKPKMDEQIKVPEGQIPGMRGNGRDPYQPDTGQETHVSSLERRQNKKGGTLMRRRVILKGTLE